MGNFTKAFTRTYEFDGDNISVEFTRLKRKDAMTLAPYITDGGEDVKVAFKDQLEFLNAASEILPTCIVKFRGLTIEGQLISELHEDFKLIFSEIYFMELLSDMLGDLMEASFLQSGERDDIKKPQENTLMDSEHTDGS